MKQSVHIIEPHFVTVIERHSDYQAHEPYWIDLCRNVKDEVLRKRISDALNKFFEKHGPDANEDYSSTVGRLMQIETCRKALNHALRVCKCKDIEVDNLIDGVGSVESDGRENDPCTGELLHVIPISKDSVIEEIGYLIDQDKLSKDDWVWLNFVTAEFGTHNPDVNAMLRQVTRKHR